MRKLLAKRNTTTREKRRKPLSFDDARSQTLGWNTKSRTNVNSFNVKEHSLETLLEQSMRDDLLNSDAYIDRTNEKAFSGPWTNTPQFTTDLNNDPYPYIPETEVSEKKWEQWSNPPFDRFNVEDWIDYRYSLAQRVDDRELRNKIMGLLSEPILDIVPPQVYFKIWKKEKLQQKEQEWTQNNKEDEEEGEYEEGKEYEAGKEDEEYEEDEDFLEYEVDEEDEEAENFLEEQEAIEAKEEEEEEEEDEDLLEEQEAIEAKEAEDEDLLEEPEPKEEVEEVFQEEGEEEIDPTTKKIGDPDDFESLSTEKQLEMMKKDGQAELDRKQVDLFNFKKHGNSTIEVNTYLVEEPDEGENENKNKYEKVDENEESNEYIELGEREVNDTFDFGEQLGTTVHDVPIDKELCEKHGIEVDEIQEDDNAIWSPDEELIDEAIQEEGGARPVLLSTDGEEPTLDDVMLNSADQAIFREIRSDDELAPGAASDLVVLFEKHLQNLREQKQAEDMLSLDSKLQIINKQEAQALLKREDFYRKLNSERLNYLSQTRPEEEIKEIIAAHREAAQEWTKSKIIKYYIEKRKSEMKVEFEEEREKRAWEKEERHQAEKTEKLEELYQKAYKAEDIFESIEDSKEAQAAAEAERQLDKEIEEEECEEKEHDRIRHMSPKEMAEHVAKEAAKDIVEAGNSIRTQDLFHFSFGLNQAGNIDESQAPKRYHKIVDEDGAENIIDVMWNDGVWEYEEFKSEYRKPYVLRDIRKSREKREHLRFRVENTLKYYHFLRKAGHLR